MSYYKHSYQGLFYDYHRHRMCKFPLIRPNQGVVSRTKRRDEPFGTIHETALETKTTIRVEVGVLPNPNWTNQMKRLITNCEYLQFDRALSISILNKRIFFLLYELNHTNTVLIATYNLCWKDWQHFRKQILRSVPSTYGDELIIRATLSVLYPKLDKQNLVIHRI